MGVEEKVMVDSPFSVPVSDYDKNGNVKKVRGYVLKKLLKYEIKPIFTTYLILLVILVTAIISTCSSASLMKNLNPESMGYYNAQLSLIFSIMLFAGIGGTLLCMMSIKTSNRFKKCFFGSHGYVMLSVPATIEEHLLAKQIVSVVLNLISTILIILGIVLAFTFGGGANEVFKFADFPALCALRKTSIIFKWLNVILLVVFVVVADNTIVCFFRNKSGVFKALSIVITVITLEVFFGWFINVNVSTNYIYDFLSNETVNFLTTLFGTVFLIGGSILGFFYQARVLKNKINL